MTRLSEKVQPRVTEEMKQRAEQAAKNGYGSEAQYIREMWLAGESAVAELDPRVGAAAEANNEIDSVEAAAKTLDDRILLSELSDEKQEFEDIVQRLTQEFENVLADRLYELANNEQSAVETDGRGNYYLEG